MATVARAYGPFIVSALSKEIAWLSDTVKCALCTSSYTPDQNDHQYFSDVTNEITGTGYTAGGETVTGKALTYDGPNLLLNVVCSTVTWSTVTIAAARYAVFYVDTGTAATSPLVSYMDFGVDRSAAATSFDVTVPGSGLLALAVD